MINCSLWLTNCRLRASHYLISLAQLIAITVMIILRAIIRRDLLRGPAMIERNDEPHQESSSVKELPAGYELEFMSKSIAKVKQWKVLSHPYGGSHDPTSSPTDNNLAIRVRNVRVSLANLCELNWQPELHRVATAVEHTMDTIMNHLWSKRGKVVIPDINIDILCCEIPVNVVTNAETSHYQVINLEMNKQGGARWERWKANTNHVQAILYL